MVSRVWAAAKRTPLPSIFIISLFITASLPGLHAGTNGATIVDPTVSYTNSTGGGGLGSFNSSGLDPGYDDDEVLFRFTVSQTSTLTSFTTSFASGGFAPDLTLFYDDGTPGDPTGLYIAEGSEGITGSCGATQATDAATGYCLDSFLQTVVNPGSYLLVLTEDPNISGGLGYAFDYGNAFLQYPPFTSNPIPPPDYVPSQNNFNNGFQLFGNPSFPRTANYDVEADLAAVSATPEPGTLFLLISGFAGAFAYRRYIPEERQ